MGRDDRIDIRGDMHLGVAAPSKCMSKDRGHERLVGTYTDKRPSSLKLWWTGLLGRRTVPFAETAGRKQRADKLRLGGKIFTNLVGAGCAFRDRQRKG